MALLLLLLPTSIACTAQGPQSTATSPGSHAISPAESSSRGSDADLQDPLEALEDPASPDFVDATLTPLVARHDSGPSVYRLDDLKKAKEIVVYVSCSPSRAFTVRLLDNFTSGECTPRFQSYASFPVPPGTGSTTLRLEIPRGVDHYVVAIPE